MHGNAANIRRFSYAAIFERGGSLARHRVKLLMTALMMFGMATQAQGAVEQVAPVPGACFSSSITVPAATRWFMLAFDPARWIFPVEGSVSPDAFCSAITSEGNAPCFANNDYVYSAPNAQHSQHRCIHAPYGACVSPPPATTTPRLACPAGYSLDIGLVSCPVPTVNPTVPYSYNANTSMCEREVNQYTLTLHNLAAELEPFGTKGGNGNTSSTATVQVVNAQTQEPKAGVQVRIAVDVNANTGGHDHHDSPKRRPRGTLSGCTVSGQDAILCTTGPDGKADFTFTAPEPSGTHRLTAECTNPVCSNGLVMGNVDVKVAGLVGLTEAPFYYAFIGGETGKPHTDNHYLTPAAESALHGIAVSYRFASEFTVGGIAPPIMQVNDASLIWGGRFDVAGDWAGSHFGHRRGVVIDVRANPSGAGAIPPALFTDFIKMSKTYGVEAQVHCKDKTRQPPTCVGSDGSPDNNRHFHILLLGVDQ